MSVSFIKEDGSLRCLSGHYLHEGRGDLHAFHKLAARQASLSKAQLSDQQAQLLGPQGLLMNFGRQIARLGRQAPLLEDVLELEDGESMELAEQSVRFVLGQHDRCAACDNPFSGNTRELLCCVVFDDGAPYTLAERYAASEALRQQDAQFFFRLIATTVNTVERRFVFQGLLEHFDRLLPIEQSIYPPDYRQVQQKHLDREETLYGKLELDKPVSKLLQEHSPEWLLENISTVNKRSY
ncbi:MAG TPA: hypothetical protein VF671_03895 [Pseudomonas sp.]|jgi:hypothetical protein|uniref:hypothetical protein n=1 Tax=Pseudomonas sp. TaxID=306 RepID=UPI002EDA085F